MPLCLDHISDPITAILVSVTAVLIFGEVVPQALCTRYGLAIGAALSPLVYVLMVITFIVAYPISKLLDIILGEDHGTFYRRAELKVLVGMHGPQPSNRKHHSSANEDPLTKDEVLVIRGALELREKEVSDAMVPIKQVYMLSIETALTDTTMAEILWAGHSRIPVFDTHPENIVGVLLVKTLLSINPAHKIVLKDMLNTKCIRAVYRVYDSMPLYELLDVFQTGKCHLSIVYRNDNIDSEDKTLLEPDANCHILGIITLEDVIEELIQEEIYDEKDVPDGRIQSGSSVRLARRKFRAPWKLHRSEGDRLQISRTNKINSTIQDSDEISIDCENDSTFLVPPDREIGLANAKSLP